MPPLLPRSCASALPLLGLLACAGDAPPPPLDDSAPVEGSELEVVAGEPVTCADPAARERAPFERLSLGGAWEDQPWQDNEDGQYTGGGLVVADLTGDGRPEILLTHIRDTQLFVAQPDGTWVEEGAQRLPASLPDYQVGGSVADVDGDGDLDLYLQTLFTPNALLENDGEGRFTDVSDRAGVSGVSTDTNGATWADLDDDGDLDLAVAYHNEGEELGEGLITGDMPPAQPNELYLNDGDGGFTDASGDLPEAFRQGYSFVVGVDDFNGDGRDDLYAVNDFGPQVQPNLLALGGEDGWVEEGGELGLDLTLYGMGLGIGDLNGDGVPDLAISSWGELALLESGGGFWVRADQARGLVGVGDQSVAWGIDLADVDNDGDLDIPVGFGPLSMPEEYRGPIEDAVGASNAPEQPDALFLRQPDGSYVDVAPDWGVDDPIVARGFAVVDLDRDGWLDLIKRDLRGPAVLHRANCGEASWTRIHLRGPAPNRFAVDAVVEVTAGGLTQRRRVRSGGQNLGVGLGPELHFGLGQAEQIDELVVIWPDGERSTLTGLEVNRDLTLRRPDAP